MGNADDINENMLKANKIIRDMRIVMNKRDNELHSKYADLIEVQSLLADTTRLTRFDFPEHVLTRTLIMSEIDVLKRMYDMKIENMRCELATLDEQFKKLSEQCF
jgi:hypothetical protein